MISNINSVLSKAMPQLSKFGEKCINLLVRNGYFRCCWKVKGILIGKWQGFFWIDRISSLNSLQMLCLLSLGMQPTLISTT